MKKNLIEIFLHLLFWVLSFWVLNEMFQSETEEVQEINGVRTVRIATEYLMHYFFLFGLLAKAVLVYGNAFFLLPPFFKNRNWTRYLFRFSLLLAFTILLECGLNYFFTYWGLTNSLRFFQHVIFLNAFLYFFLTAISVGYAMGKAWHKNERLKRQLTQEKMQAELKFLKSQINPHFLFNTLNNLFAISERHQNTELSTGIIQLSELMRYMLYDAKAERVSLEKELTYLKSVIEIQQLRISEEDDVVIALNLVGDFSNHQIAPLILVPFVENAFKHGINWKESSFIKIDLKAENGQLSFEVINSNVKSFSNGHDQHSGVGLANVQRRLDLIYPDRHQLKIEETETVFKVKLLLNVSE